MKLCVDCRYHMSAHRCSNPVYVHISPVDGFINNADCAIQRAAFSLPACGPEGRGFESKEREEL